MVLSHFTSTRTFTQVLKFTLQVHLPLNYHVSLQDSCSESTWSWGGRCRRAIWLFTKEILQMKQRKIKHITLGHSSPLALWMWTLDSHLNSKNFSLYLILWLLWDWEGKTHYWIKGLIVSLWPQWWLIICLSISFWRVLENQMDLYIKTMINRWNEQVNRLRVENTHAHTHTCSHTCTHIPCTHTNTHALSLSHRQTHTHGHTMWVIS